MRLNLFAKISILFILIIIFSICGFFLVSFLLGPPNLNIEQNTMYYSEDGEVIGEEKGVENRYWIDLADMSPYIIDATIMIEDQRFYKHKGLDFKRIGGAILSDVKSMSLKEGASTLTQQYARNLYLTQDKTWSRKLKEAFYAIRIEMFYSKAEILEGYLNTIYYGHGAYGIEAASKYFFNKSAASLTLAEAAMLAGIPKGPTYYSPFNDIEKATARQHLILQVMLEENTISKTAYTAAMGEKLAFSKPLIQLTNSIGPYFFDVALREAANLLHSDVESIRSGGFHLYTTLDVKNQKSLERAIKQAVNPVSEVEVGAMAIEPTSGAIRALAGGRDYLKSPFNRAVDAKRMPGSTFKPFLYYAALENGYNARTMLKSEPSIFVLDDGKTYEPRNFNGYYAYEPITMAQALALSDNIYAVKTHLYLGMDRLVKTARQFGFSENMPAVASLALGTASVTVAEMVTGYGMLANGGQALTPYALEKIVDRNGKTVYVRDTPPKKNVLDPKKAFILTDLMTGMFDHELDGYTTVTGATIVNQLTRTYAGKSGTTNSDSWMIGYSPELVAGVWIGYDDNRAMELVPERSYAKQIWATFMEAAHQKKEMSHFLPPDGIIAVPIDPITGQRATPNCPTSRIMYFEKGDEPKYDCSMHFQQHADDKGMFEKWFDIFFR